MPGFYAHNWQIPPYLQGTLYGWKLLQSPLKVHRQEGPIKVMS